jgi:hypothetical protein
MFARAHRRAAAAFAFVVVMAIFAPAAPGAADSVATPGETAVVPLPAPPRTGGAVYLDVLINAYTPPARGSIDAVVALANSKREIEIGRVTIFPNQAFAAKDGEPGRSYRFNVSSALAALFVDGGPLELRVRLVPIDPKLPIEGARMTIGAAEYRGP